jgi:hypothetical protein
MTGFTNAGFESGDFTGWSTDTGDGGLLYVQSSTKSEGSYALCSVLSSNGDPVSQNFKCAQTIDFTDIDSVTFDINITKMNGGGAETGAYIEVSIDGTGYATYTATTSGFTTATINTSGLSGELEFMMKAYCPKITW